jgi:urea transporter
VSSIAIRREVHVLKIIFKGMGQVMLQNSAVTGFLFLVGIFFNSWTMGIGALTGVVAGTVTAFFLGYDRKDIRKGLYGFNGTLAGVAIVFFFGFSALSLSFVILGSALSSLIMNFMHERKLCPYTFPFVLSTWIFIILIKVFNILPLQAEGAFQARELIISSIGMGFGQVMFQANIITGFVFFLAVLVNSRYSAAYGLLGSVTGMMIALAFSFPLNLIDIGIFGFNGVLCGIAFSGRKPGSFVPALISIALSVFITYSMLNFSLITLTAPFVFSSWIVLATRKRIKYPG